MYRAFTVSAGVPCGMILTFSHEAPDQPERHLQVGRPASVPQEPLDGPPQPGLGLQVSSEEDAGPAPGVSPAPAPGVALSLTPDVGLSVVDVVAGQAPWPAEQLAVVPLLSEHAVPAPYAVVVM